MGLSTGVLTFATIYFGQARFTSQIKGMKRSTIILSSSFFALTTGDDSQELCDQRSVSAYLITSAKLHECERNLKKSAMKES